MSFSSSASCWFKASLWPLVSTLKLPGLWFTRTLLKWSSNTSNSKKSSNLHLLISISSVLQELGHASIIFLHISSLLSVLPQKSHGKETAASPPPKPLRCGPLRPRPACSSWRRDLSGAKGRVLRFWGFFFWGGAENTQKNYINKINTTLDHTKNNNNFPARKAPHLAWVVHPATPTPTPQANSSTPPAASRAHPLRCIKPPLSQTAEGGVSSYSIIYIYISICIRWHGRFGRMTIRKTLNSNKPWFGKVIHSHDDHSICSALPTGKGDNKTNMSYTPSISPAN